MRVLKAKKSISKFGPSEEYKNQLKKEKLNGQYWYKMFNRKPAFENGPVRDDKVQNENQSTEGSGSERSVFVQGDYIKHYETTLQGKKHIKNIKKTSKAIAFEISHDAKPKKALTSRFSE